MNVVVNKIIAVLKVLSFGNTVGCNKNINLRRIIRHKQLLVLGYRREASEDCIQIRTSDFCSCSAFNCTCYHCGIKTKIVFYVGANICIKILCRIGKSGENNNFFVGSVNGIFDFIFENAEKCLQFVVVFGSDITHHKAKQIKNFFVLRKAFFPRDIVHIGKVDFDFSAEGEKLIAVLVFRVKIINSYIKHINAC